MAKTMFIVKWTEQIFDKERMKKMETLTRNSTNAENESISYGDLYSQV